MCVGVHRHAPHVCGHPQKTEDNARYPQAGVRRSCDTWHGCFLMKISKCSYTPSHLSSLPFLYIFETWSLSLYIPGWLGT